MKQNKNFLVVISLILLAAISRLIPHAPNFTAVGAIALFGAAYLKDKRLALIVPLIGLWFSDVLLNHTLYSTYYSGASAWFGNLYTYIGFIAIGVLGLGMLKKVNLKTVFGSSVIASAVFFLISNFGVWISSVAYPKTLGGLGMAYAAGVPFFWNTLAANVLYCIILFGIYEWVLKPKLELA